MFIDRVKSSIINAITTEKMIPRAVGFLDQKLGFQDAIKGVTAFSKRLRNARVKDITQGWLTETLDHLDQHGIYTPENYTDYSDAYKKVVWAYACVSVIKDNFMQLPLVIYQPDNTPLPDTYFFHKIFRDPNPLQSRVDLFESLAGYMAIAGNAYWAFEPKVKGNTSGEWEIYPLRPDRVRVVADSQKMIGGYIYEVAGRTIPYEPNEILHFKDFSPSDDFYGWGPMQVARESIITEVNTTIYNKSFFENSGRPDAVLQTEQTIIDPADMRRVRESWKAEFGGIKKSQGVLILGSGLKYSPIKFNPKDMEYIAGKKISREEICGAFGVPSGIVGILEYANYANLREQREIFWTNTIIPKCVKYAANIEKLINTDIYFKNPNVKRGIQYHVEFDFSNVAVLQKNRKEQAEEDEINIRIGKTSVNELRERDGYDRREDEYGDSYSILSQINTVSVSTAENTAIQNITRAITEQVSKNIAIEIKKAVLKSSIFIGQKGANKDSEELEEIYENFVKTTEELEEQFLENLTPHWLKIYNEISRRFKKYYTKKDADDSLAIDLMSIISDKDLWEKELLLFGNPEITRMVLAAGVSALEKLNIEVNFNINSPKVVEWIQDKAQQFATKVTETTWDNLRDSLVFGISEGETIEELSERVQAVMDGVVNVSGSADVVSDARGRMIARTEVIGATNAGEFHAYLQSGLVLEKGWISTISERTRPSHRVVMSALVEEPFVLNSGAMLMFPGDPSLGAPASEVINCRCALYPVKFKE